MKAKEIESITTKANELSNKVLLSIRKFNNSKRSYSDRLAIQQEMKEVINELPKYILSEGRWWENDDKTREWAYHIVCESIPLEGDIVPQSVSERSEHLGYMLLCDLFKPSI